MFLNYINKEKYFTTLFFCMAEQEKPPLSGDLPLLPEVSPPIRTVHDSFPSYGSSLFNSCSS